MTVPGDARPGALSEAADALAMAERDRRPIPLLSRTIPALTRAEAYAIAELRVARCGRTSVGYKLGYTSAAMRAQMGVREPNYGILLKGSQVARGAAIPLDELIHPMIEPEVTLLMQRDLAGPGIEAGEAWAAVEAVIPSLEIVDTRYEDYTFTAPDNIADNSSAARFVLGDPVARDALKRRQDCQVRLERDGSIIETGSSGDAMGDPAAALAWLANALTSAGTRINAGDLVMTGGLTRAHPVSAGSRFSAHFDGLGSVAAQA